jgi:hypothetical protein
MVHGPTSRSLRPRAGRLTLVSCAVRGAGVVLSVALVLMPAAAQAAGSSFTWKGDAKSTGWSAAGNWEGGEAPSAGSGPVKLVFPWLTGIEGGNCGNSKPAEACYLGLDDVSGLTAESIAIDDGRDYGIFGSFPLTLGAGGLTALPDASSAGFTTAELDLPIVLGASQTWSVSGSSGAGPERLLNNTLHLGGEVSGAGSALTVKMADGVGLYAGGAVEVGPLTIEGAQAEGLTISNGVLDLAEGAALDSVDGEPVDLSHVYFAGAGAVGALHTSDASLAVGETGEHAGKLQATSVTLDRDTSVGFEIRGTSPAPGVDYGEIVADGPVNLADAFLAIYVPKPCEAPSVGQVYMLLETSGELTGSFGGAFEGAEIPVEFFKECGTQPSVKVKIEYHRGGAVNTVTATVLAPPRVGTPESPPAAATTPVVPPPPGKGSLALAGTTVPVQAAGVAQVKLECRGSETCSGKLTLSAKIAATAKGKNRQRSRTATIGTASFSVSGDEAKTVEIKLDAAARTALNSDRGRLSASLALLELAPNPANTQTASVDLVQHLRRKTRDKAHGKRNR